MENISKLLSVARGESPADRVLRGGKIVNVFSGEIEEADIAICGEAIAGVGRGYAGVEEVDLGGMFVGPGFIDAHVHIESSLCTPGQFAAALAVRGVTAAVADPHELANVAGLEGVRFMWEAAKRLPVDVVIMAPSCVPATELSSSGGQIGVEDVRELRESGVAGGLAEVMNYPAVVRGEAAMLGKIAAMEGMAVDGHFPDGKGMALCAYVAAGVGSDHESMTADEAREKLARGMYVLIREATNARNLAALLPMVTRSNSRRVCFCTDDRTPDHLVECGSVDDMVRQAIAGGVEPIEAIRMATLNPAEWFGLRKLGAVAPGRKANLIVFENLRELRAKMVFSGGKLVARDGKLIEEIRGGSVTLGKCRVAWEAVNLGVQAKGERIRVIGAQPDQLVTDHRVMAARIVEGKAAADVGRDVLKVAVIERHRASGKMGVGFIQGFGLKRGAIAGTIAHDHHNLIVIGADDESMMTAARAAAEGGGGLAGAAGTNVVAQLALPIGGLMSDKPLREVASGYKGMVQKAKQLGSPLRDPFMAMSFMGLEVIGALKLTDRGLVDVEQFQIVDLFV